MRRLDRYLLRRGFLACLPLLLMFCLAGQALLASTGLAISARWLPYLSLPAVLMLASFYTVLRSIHDGEGIVPSLAGLSYLSSYRALSILGATLWLLLAILPVGTGASTTLDDLLQFDAGSGWRAFSGPGTLLAYRKHQGSEFENVLLLEVGKQARCIEKLKHLETLDGKQHFLADEQELVLTLRQRRPTRLVRRQFFERSPIASFGRSKAAWLHLLFALFCTVLPMQVARQFQRFKAGTRLRMLLAIALPLASGLALFWLISAQALFGIAPTAAGFLALLFLSLPLL